MNDVRFEDIWKRNVKAKEMYMAGGPGRGYLIIPDQLMKEIAHDQRQPIRKSPPRDPKKPREYERLDALRRMQPLDALVFGYLLSRVWWSPKDKDKKKARPDQGRINPCIERIANELGYGRDAVLLSLERLRRRKWIEWICTRSSNQYSVLSYDERANALAEREKSKAMNQALSQAEATLANEKNALREMEDELDEKIYDLTDKILEGQDMEPSESVKEDVQS